MATKNNKRTKITKLLLRNSLLELLKTEPISSISIKEICANADLNRSTFYLHYLDQYELFQEIQQDFLDSTLDCLQDVDNTTSAIGYIIEFLKYIKKESELFKILLCNQSDIDFENKYITNSMNFIKIRINIPWPKEMEQYVASFLVQGSLSILQTWALNGCQTPIEDLAKLIYELCNKITG